MQKFLLIICLAFCLQTLIAQDNGIHFSKKNWDEILVEAKAQDKLIFVDAFTTWCGPCKMMSSKIFPLKEVGDFYNEHFINVKKDMEKGDGPALASLYGVQAYPTLLFINGDGEMMHRGVGYQAAPDLLKLGKDAMDPDSQIGALDQRYYSGDRDPEFLKNYIEIKAGMYDGSHEPIMAEYLQSQNDWSQPQILDLIFNYTLSVQNPGFNYMREASALFESRFGKDVFNQRMKGLINSAMANVNPEAPLEESLTTLKTIDPDNYDKNSNLLKMNYYRQRGDRTGYAKATENYMDNHDGQSWDELNEICWTFYQVVDDKKLLKKAAKWAKRSVKMDTNAYNTDTLAALYYKLGKKRKSLKEAEKALAMGTSAGLDMSGTEELIQKIKEL